MDEFFVRKWTVLSNLLRQGGTSQTLSQLKGLKREAQNRQHWETLRQCDRYLAFVLRDEPLLLHLYFGTPYSGFRNRLLEEFPKEVSLPDHYHWVLRGPRHSAPIYDLMAGDSIGLNSGLKVGQLLHRMMGVLTSDFYRPFRLANIHFHLYPNEYFNPVTSPPRVHEAAKRLRLWIEASKLPLVVFEQQGQYSLNATQPFTLSITRNIRIQLKHYEVAIEKLKTRWPNEPFSIHEASHTLGKPVRTTLRLLGEAIKANTLKRVGSTRATRYVVRG